jgi:Fe-S cluster assembly scaffold protein SufB
MVYNDFFIGEDSDVVIVAGCGIHNCGTQKSQHDGIHTFYVGKNAKVKYIEKHYGEKDPDATGGNIMNPTTIVEIEEGGYLEMETTQIKGIDSTIRDTSAVLGEGANLIVKEKIMTHGKQKAETNFIVDLNKDVEKMRYPCFLHIQTWHCRNSIFPIGRKFNRKSYNIRSSN